MHVVTFTNAEGKSATHQTESLEDAIKFIEHIRNTESIGDAKLFRMTEIPIEVKAYYKVEIGGPGDVVVPASQPAVTTPQVTAPAPENNAAPAVTTPR